MIVFPASLVTTDVLSQGPSEVSPEYVRSRRRGIVSLGHYFFTLSQQLNVFPFHCLFLEAVHRRQHGHQLQEQEGGFQQDWFLLSQSVFVRIEATS